MPARLHAVVKDVFTEAMRSPSLVQNTQRDFGQCDSQNLGRFKMYCEQPEITLLNCPVNRVFSLEVIHRAIPARYRCVVMVSQHCCEFGHAFIATSVHAVPGKLRNAFPR